MAWLAVLQLAGLLGVEVLRLSWSDHLHTFIPSHGQESMPLLE